MNPPIDSPNPAPNLPPLPAPTPPLPPDAGFGLVIEALLKRPTQLIAALCGEKGVRISIQLVVVAGLALAAYGFLVGTFSGGRQLLAAPLKISFGALFSMLICLPSLFIFACLAGAEITLRATIGVLCSILALTSLLLIGFAPIAWVFSQSTESLGFIGALHLLFWFIGLGFGLRMLGLFMNLLRISSRLHLRLWSLIFLLVSLQMTTALRPIIGTAEHWLPTEKRFFLAYWMENVFGGAPTVRAAE